MNNERDSFDDLFKAKLKDLEADTPSGGWDALEKRLSKPKVFLLRKHWMYGAAAVLLVLCLGGIGLYRQLLHQPESLLYSHTPPTGAPTGAGENEETSVTPPNEPPLPPETAPEGRANNSAPLFPAREITFTAAIVARSKMDKNYGGQLKRTGALAVPGIPAIQPPKALLVADAGLVKTKAARGAIRKWSFGTGFGGMTAGSNNMANTYLLRSSDMMDYNLMALNAPIDFNSDNMPRTNIKHKMPISFGISASRYLNDRWSLQTGLSYTLQRSEWETTGLYYNKTKQYLHLIGIPLALTFKVAGWNKFLAYASAGGMGEINVAGREKTDSYVDDKKIYKDEWTSVRMKELQWSVNARAGVSYPLIYPMSAYVEIGASYYFDNGSKTKTIYSDKQLNISPQFGLRFSF